MKRAIAALPIWLLATGLTGCGRIEGRRLSGEPTDFCQVAYRDAGGGETGTYLGECQGKLPHGVGTVTFASGEVLEAEFRRGVLSTSGTRHAASAEADPACGALQGLTSRAYSPMFIDGTLHVFAVSGPRLDPIATIEGLQKPGELVVTSDGRKIYVNDWGTSSLRVIDACTLKTTQQIEVGTNSIATYIPADGRRFDGRYIYVSSAGRGLISVVDTRTDAIVRRFHVPGLVNVHLAPDGRRLYALSYQGVWALDSLTGQPVAPPLRPGRESVWPTWATTSTDGKKLYLADTGGDALVVVDAETMQIRKVIGLPFGTSPIVAKIRPDGREVWLANGASSNGVVVVSTATDTITKVIPTQGLAGYVSFSPDGRLAYVADVGPTSQSSHLGLYYLFAAALGFVHGKGEILVIDTATLERAGPALGVGQLPGDVATVQPGIVSGG